MKRYILLALLLVTFKTYGQYCDASGPSCSVAANGWISSVEVVPSANNFINNSGCGDGSFGAPGYSDYTAMVAEIDMSDAPQIFVSGAGYAEMTCVVYIDMNQNESFEDLGEMFLLVGHGLTGYTGVLTPSLDMVEGTTRMRIRYFDALLGLDPLGLLPCGTSSYGEVEDYTVNITGALVNTTPDCAQNPVPADLAVDICNSGDSLKFEAPDADLLPLFAPTGYIISLWTDNGTIDYLIEDSNIADVLAFDPGVELTPNETYFWQVKPYNLVDTNLTCDTWSFTTSSKPNPSPQITIDGIVSDSLGICVEIDNQLGVYDINGTDLTGATYLWSENEPNEDPISDLNINNPINSIAVADVTYDIAILVTDDIGCAGVDTVKVTTKPRANVGNIITTSTQICENDITDLYLDGADGDSFEWLYSNNGTNYTTTADFDTAHTTMPITQDVYYLAIASLNGCADSAEVLITKLDLPLQPSVIASMTEFCSVEDSVELTTNWPGPGTLEWNNVDTTIGASLWVSETGIYNVKGIGVNGCVSVSADVTITKIETPDQPTITQHSNSDYSANSNGTNYLWYRNDTLIFTSNDTNFVAPENGDYYVVAENGGCLSEPSDVFQVNLATNIGENGLLLIDLVNLYPNPNNGSFYIELSQEVDLKVYDLNGRHIMTKQLFKGKNTVELNINSGTYIVEYSVIGSPRAFDRLIVH